MAAAIPTVQDCCDTCVCNVVSVDLPCPPGSAGPLVVENLSALRLVLANQRTQNMEVIVLTFNGEPLDGSGWRALWREDELTPDAPPMSTRPADVLDDSTPGRFMQIL